MTPDKIAAPAKTRSAPHPLSVYLGAAMTMPGANQADVERMVRGIRKYQAHPFYREAPELEVVWRKGASSLSFRPAEEPRKGCLLLVPSMINGPEILDLLPEHSFMRWLTRQGFDVYLLDWGDPAGDEGLESLDSGVLLRLGNAAQFLHSRTGDPVDTVGYCMGGTLVLAAAARAPEIFGRLVLLSAPWDFHAGDTRMMAQVMTGTPTALQLLETKASLPVDWIQNVFARVNPELAVKKFSNFLDMASGGMEEKIFIAVEDWLNGGHDLSAGVARTCLIDWYGRNAPMRGEWANLAILEGHPALIVAADKDILVPPESTIAALQQMPWAEIIRPSCGHISLMAGKNAAAAVWQPIAAWLEQTA